MARQIEVTVPLGDRLPLSELQVPDRIWALHVVACAIHGAYPR